MSKSQRTKGAAGEREVCHILRDRLGVEARGNLTQIVRVAATLRLDASTLKSSVGKALLSRLHGSGRQERRGLRSHAGGGLPR